MGILVLINLKFWPVLNTVYWNNLPTPLKPLNNMYIYTLCPKHLHLQSWPKFCTAVIEKFRWYSVHYYIQYTVYGQTFRVQRGQIPPPKKNYIKKNSIFKKFTRIWTWLVASDKIWLRNFCLLLKFTFDKNKLFRIIFITVFYVDNNANVRWWARAVTIATSIKSSHRNESFAHRNVCLLF